MCYVLLYSRYNRYSRYMEKYWNFLLLPARKLFSLRSWHFFFLVLRTDRKTVDTIGEPAEGGATHIFLELCGSICYWYFHTVFFSAVLFFFRSSFASNKKHTLNESRRSWIKFFFSCLNDTRACTAYVSFAYFIMLNTCPEFFFSFYYAHIKYIKLCCTLFLITAEKLTN